MSQLVSVYQSPTQTLDALEEMSAGGWSGFKGDKRRVHGRKSKEGSSGVGDDGGSGVWAKRALAISCCILFSLIGTTAGK